MVAKNIKWTFEKYRAALLGDAAEGVRGVRSLAYGFNAGDGFNLHDFDSWTPAQKRRLRETYNHVRELEAQPKTIIRPRNEKNLRKLQQSFHGETPSKNLKVAFIPFVSPIQRKPGAKAITPDIRILKSGLSIKTPHYEKIFIPFNHRNLARDPRGEIAKAAAQMPGASLFYVQVGNNETVRGDTINRVTDQILKWMAQYDGKKAIPKSSGNRGDNPKHHHWKLWLDGLAGYVLPKRNDISKLQQAIVKGRAANKRRRQSESNFLKRKGRKK